MVNMNSKNKGKKSAFAIAFMYAFTALLWILFSDMAVNALFQDPFLREQAQSYKGAFFVLATSLILMFSIIKNNSVILKANDLDLTTGLPRLSMFLRMVDVLLKTPKVGEQYVICYVDIDDFHSFKIKIGADNADKYINELSQDLSTQTYHGSIVSHVHADEFLVLIKLTDLNEIDDIVEKIQHLVLMRSHRYGDTTNCCIGVSIFPRDGNSARKLFSSAVRALEMAKEKGNYIYFHDQSLTQRAKLRRGLYLNLREAIENESLSVVYQPKYSLDSTSVCGVEVLARWNHSEQGFIPPDVFIPIAEDYSLIHALTKLVLKLAIEQLIGSGLIGTYLRHVSVNVSSSEFNSREEMMDLIDFVKTYPDIAQYIRLEVTERAALKELKRSGDFIAEAQKDGFTFSIDDFGTGYTSLAILKDLAINEIKIDRSFIAELAESNRSKTIVYAIIGMARSFEIDVVAEGVENETQLTILKELWCQQVQGFYLAHPMPLAELKNHLKLGI
jgi:diguanylate cyclase